MDQFIVKPLFRVIEPGTCVPAQGIHDGCLRWYEISNATLWMAIAVLVIIALMVFGSRGRAVIPSRIQSVGEMIYGLIYKMVEDVTGHDGVKYFPFVMTLFLFVLFSNLLGLLPKGFTTTSHAAVTVTLALIVFLFVTLLGLARNGLGFLGMFWVSSAPLALRPVLAVIEVISYFVRPVSHSIRLAGNLMAGHAVMKVFAGFASVALISPVAIGAITAIYGLELLVAVVQAYVFTILTCVYLKDAVGGAHH
ncbi:MAG: F0F1 ATP synthase subunit A [Gemmobacter sp.]|jgi:F-type H+-transporting ATPase subunit a|nr:F0F1 ATP synthase subunit A [Gemmobacter sp.]